MCVKQEEKKSLKKMLHETFLTERSAYSTIVWSRQWKYTMEIHKGVKTVILSTLGLSFITHPEESMKSG